MNLFDNLPNTIKFKVILFLINTDLINNNTNKDWCVKCGKQVFKNHMCASNKCLDCCYLHCVNRGNFYITPSKSKPFRFDDDLLAHY